MSDRLPFEIREAIVQVAGIAFWYKDPLRSFLVSAGVPQEVYEQFSELSKYKIARSVLSALDGMGERGFVVQRRMLTDLCNLKGIPDEGVPDRDAAVRSLQKLKALALQHQLLVEENRSAKEHRVAQAKAKEEALAARAQKLLTLKTRFGEMVTATNPQARGYDLEALVSELYAAFEIPFRPAYKTQTEQIDGSFEFKGFPYLIEARWRVDPPNQGDLAAFKIKVDKKLTSTRGLFFSIVGFRDEVVSEFTRGVSSNVILFSGEDLICILEGFVSLTDALDIKIQKATQEGAVYYKLSDYFRR